MLPGKAGGDWGHLYNPQNYRKSGSISDNSYRGNSKDHAGTCLKLANVRHCGFVSLENKASPDSLSQSRAGQDRQHH
jgi:hypothetical protein